LILGRDATVIELATTHRTTAAPVLAPDLPLDPLRHLASLPATARFDATVNFDE
jgi:hypothetical protein